MSFINIFITVNASQEFHYFVQGELTCIKAYGNKFLFFFNFGIHALQFIWLFG